MERPGIWVSVGSHLRMSSTDMEEHLSRWAAEDRRRLLALIPSFHGYFARTKDPIALDVARNIGIALRKL